MRAASGGKRKISPGAKLGKQGMELGENSMHRDWHMQSNVGLTS